MKIYVGFDPADNRVVGWGSSPVENNCIEVEVDDNHEVLMSPGHFFVRDGELVKNEQLQLELAQQSKIAELDQRCEEAILGRFSVELDGVVYAFSNDREAQANFDKCDNSFARGRITEIPWTAYDPDGNVRRIVLDAVKFEKVYVAHLEHIQGNIAKFRDFLEPLVVGAAGVDEVNLIQW